LDGASLELGTSHSVHVVWLISLSDLIFMLPILSQLGHHGSRI